MRKENNGTRYFGFDEVAKEETRLLYVAMTRAIYGLYCFVERKNHVTGTPSTWAELLPEVRDNA